MRFDIASAAAAFFSVEIQQLSGEFLDGIGYEALAEFIQTESNLLDYMPDENKMDIKGLVMPFMRFINDMSIEFLYVNLPEEYREFFESRPNGARWALIQLTQIKAFLTS